MRLIMRKTLATAIAVAAVVSLFACGSSAPPTSGNTPSAQAQPRIDSAGNSYYTGDGGKGKSIAILIPTGTGLSPEQNYLPALVQGVLVEDMTKYSSMRVLDRVSLDNVVAETESGIYQNEEDFIQFGEVANVGYALTGGIMKTASGYNLSIQVTDTKTGATAASHSGACTVAELDNHAGIKKASIELLGQMGVHLTDQAKRELGQTDNQDATNGQTALARGYTAQRSGTVVEAMSYYSRAVAFDPSLLEASNRVSVMFSSISGGNIAENVRSEIQRHNERERIIQEANNFFREHPPYEIVYNPNLTEGNTDYERRTVTIRTSVMASATPDLKLIRDLEQGLLLTSAMESVTPEDLKLIPNLEQKLRKAVSGNNLYGMVNTDMRFTLQAALLNESGKTIGTDVVSLNVKNGEWNAAPVSFDSVNADDISDTMGISITSINGMDMQTVQARNYISVSAFDFDNLGFECTLKENAITITGLAGRGNFNGGIPLNKTVRRRNFAGVDLDAKPAGREDFNGVIPEKIFHWPVAGIGPVAFANHQLRSVTIPNTVTAIGNEAFAYNQLESVTIPNSVTAIDYKAFAQNQLQSVTISTGITEISEGAFASNQLESVVIPSGVRKIQMAAFAGNSIKTITIGAGVEIAESAFDHDSQYLIFARRYNANNRKAGTYTLRSTFFGEPDWTFKEAK